MRNRSRGFIVKLLHNQKKEKNFSGTFYERIEARQAAKAQENLARLNSLSASPMTMEHYEFLTYLFSPAYYSDIVGLPRRSQDEIFEHFLGVGLSTGLAPSPFFDPAYYRQLLQSPPENEPLIFHWLRIGRLNQIVPTPWFDAEFYKRTYSDVASSGMFSFEHFMRHGLKEGRLPTDWFNSASFAALDKGEDEPIYQMFLSDAIAQMRPLSIISEIPLPVLVSRVALPLATLSLNIPPKKLVSIWENFDPAHYRSQIDLDQDMSKSDLVLHFLTNGVWINLSPTPTFNKAEIEKIALIRKDAARPLYWHWLTDDGLGRPPAPQIYEPAQAAPHFATPAAYLKREALKALNEVQRALLEGLFQPDFYARHANLALDRNAADLYLHFLDHGLEDGTLFSPLFNAETYSRRLVEKNLPLPIEGEAPVLHWLRIGVANAIIPTTLFSAQYYAEMNSDLSESESFGFQHFILCGQYEKRKASAWIDPNWYAPDSSRHLLINFLCHHVYEGYTPNPNIEPLRTLLGDYVKTPDFYSEVVAPIYELYPKIDQQHFDILANAVAPDYYCQKNGLGPLSKIEAAWRFLSKDMWVNADFSPLFNYSACRAAFTRKTLRQNDKAPLLLQWVIVGRRNGIVPTPYFDQNYYRGMNGDMATAKFNLFDHYFKHGVYENRIACALFDPHWYRSQAHDHPKAQSIPALFHYATYGREVGHTPCRVLACLLADHPEALTEDLYQKALVQVMGLTERFHAPSVQIALSLFVPDLSGGDISMGDTCRSAGRAVDDFCAYMDGILKGKPFSSAMFDPDVYREAANLKTTSSLFNHFLSVGVDRRIVPTLKFDASFYIHTYRDIDENVIWAYQHFILHGAYEGRLPSGRRTIAIAPPLSVQGLPATVSNWRRFWRTYTPQRFCGTDIVQSTLSLRDRVDNILDSDVFNEVIFRAQNLDPEIGSPKTYPEILVAPYHDIMASLELTLQRRFAREHYDNIVCVPWIRMGGADLVACLLAESLVRLFPDESTLIVRVDYPNFDRPDWAPEGIDAVDISDIVAATPAPERERLLYNALAGLTPNRLFNVNSRLTWLTLRRFGKRLTRQMATYAYLFCWDMNNGVRAGYPSEFYPTTAPYLTGLFTDTIYLKNELQRMYSPPPEFSQRIHPLLSPTRSALPPMMTVEETGNTRRKVYWAARLDHQKRFDLVLEIARLMPSVDFLCWGAAVLDSPPDMKGAPKNLILNSPFKNYEDLDLARCDAWLFTAAWEGLPTILIELGARGVPIVASAVGGVPELITHETGWPIYDIEDISAYVAALEEAISSPVIRNRKRKALYKFSHERHAQAQYTASLKRVLNEVDHD
jgi:glycosyltransferase involved in cell wall biosynthesis